MLPPQYAIRRRSHHAPGGPGRALRVGLDLCGQESSSHYFAHNTLTTHFLSLSGELVPHSRLLSAQHTFLLGEEVHRAADDWFCLLSCDSCFANSDISIACVPCGD